MIIPAETPTIYGALVPLTGGTVDGTRGELQVAADVAAELGGAHGAWWAAAGADACRAGDPQVQAPDGFCYAWFVLPDDATSEEQAAAAALLGTWGQP